MTPDPAPLRLIRPQDRRPGHATSCMTRHEAVAVPDALWSGLVETQPGMVSGWHHHGDHETSIYVARGVLHMEFGPGGGQVLDAAEGDFLLVPAHAVHREGNPGDAASLLVVSRAGRGEAVVNVDGPQPA